MDLRIQVAETIHVLEACHIVDAQDLVAVGTDSAVDVIHITDTALTRIASFHLGARVTAIAFSSRSVGPSASDSPIIELVAATADFGLHLLTKDGDSEPVIFPFGGGNTGHHGTVNALAFCGTGPVQHGIASSSAPADRYVASVSADQMLIVWDLHPALDIPSAYASATPDSAEPSSSARKQPTAYPIPFPHPLTALAAHPRSEKDLLVADARGTLYLIDWRSERLAVDAIGARRAALTLHDPKALSDPDSAALGGTVAWARDSPDLIAASYGTHFSLWDMSRLQGGIPTLTGALALPAFTSGARRIRFAPGPSPHFAFAPARAPAELHIRAAAFPGAAPAVLTLGARPLRVGDFDFLEGEGGRGPRVAAGVGRSVVVFWVGEE